MRYSQMPRDKTTGTYHCLTGFGYYPLAVPLHLGTPITGFRWAHYTREDAYRQSVPTSATCTRL